MKYISWDKTGNNICSILEILEFQNFVYYSNRNDISSVMCCYVLRNIESRGPVRQRAIPGISKSREEEIRKVLRNNLQNTRQRVGITANGLGFDLLVSVSVL